MALPVRLPHRVKSALTLYRQRLEALFGPRLKEMRLFGSYARGEQGTESDIDVLVLIEALNSIEAREVIGLASDVGLETDLWISAKAYTLLHYQEMLAREKPFYCGVEAEGIAV